MPTTNSSGHRLGPISYAVMGLIGLRGPSTPYDLKKASARSLSFFWPFPHTQLYTETARLQGLGLLDVTAESHGRRRKTYELTAAGEHALTTWLEHPVHEVFEMHDMAVLQLFFSEFASPERLLDIARAQVAAYEARLAVYAAIAEANRTRHRSPRRMAPLDLGVRLALTLRDFWTDIAADPPPADPGRLRGGLARLDREREEPSFPS